MAALAVIQSATTSQLHAQQAAPAPCLQQNLRGVARSLSKREARRELRCRSQPVEFEEWDIIMYDTPDGVAALGRVSQVASGELQVERLEEDATNQVWIVHGREERVPVVCVRRTLQADYLQLVDPDRVSNPHGEHALEAYRLLEPAMAAAVAAAAVADRAAAAAAAAAAGMAPSQQQDGGQAE